MSAGDKIFAGSIPENYDRHMVPLIFESYARDMSQRAAALSPKAVLEIAVRTGVVTRALADRAASQRVHRRHRPQSADARPGRSHRHRRPVAVAPADAHGAPSRGRQTSTRCCCQFGVMFFPDKAQAYRPGAARARPGGAFVFSTWDSIDISEFTDAVRGAVIVLTRRTRRAFSRARRTAIMTQR